MELLYVVELDVRSNGRADRPEVAVRQRVLDHVAAWVSYEHSPQVTADSFAHAGSAILASDRDDRADLRISWRSEGTAEVQALIVTVRTEISKSGRADFICNVTVFAEGERVSVRLELARESLDGVLAPTGIDFFRRPFLLALLLRDDDLRCSAGPSRVDGRFNWVYPQHAEYVWSALTSEGRQLPILLVDGGHEASEDLARRAARELAGLTPVLIVDAQSQQTLHDRLAELDATIPRGGARLIWPDLALRHPAFTRDQAPAAVSRLLRLLSGVSVTVRGVNQLLRTAEAARRAERAQQIAKDLSDARAKGDLSHEIQAQARVIQELKDENEQFTSWFKEVEDERDLYKSQAAQAAYWKQEAERARQASGVRTTGWDDVPDLEPYDLTNFAGFLTKESQGAIVFTREALQSWKRSAYPHVEVMSDALVTLAKAAIEYRRLGSRLGMVPDEWFKVEWALNMASTDRYMSTNGFDRFEFDGNSYSRLPHLKLGDHTSPNEVGRVYFAMDSDSERFIVDHVGLKLYGL